MSSNTMSANTNENPSRGRGRPADTVESLRERLRVAQESLFEADRVVDRSRDRVAALERERADLLAAVRSLANLLVNT